LDDGARFFHQSSDLSNVTNSGIAKPKAVEARGDLRLTVEQ